MRTLTPLWPMVVTLLGGLSMFTSPARAATITWKGHTWNVTNGGMAGVCQGNAANISVDANGYLHMKITKSGNTWTGAEIFSTDKIGFGTYQWQIEGPVDKLDKNVVVGLFPYGPEAGLGESGNNEIDIEFARWGNTSYPNGNYTIWPPTGTTKGSHTFEFSLNGGTSITTRFVWSGSKIDFATVNGFVGVDSTVGLIDAWSYAPSNPTSRITQVAMPLGMNLWCYENPPSDGQNVEIVVRDFQFVPLGSSPDGGAGGADGSADVGKPDGPDARGTVDVVANRDGAGGTAGTVGAGGVTGSAGIGGGSAVIGTGAATAGARAGASAGATASRNVGTGGNSAVGGVVASSGAGGVRIETSGASGGLGASGGVATGSPSNTAGNTSPGGGAGLATNGGTPGTNNPTSSAGGHSGGCGCKLADARQPPLGAPVLTALILLGARRFGFRRKR